MARRTAAEAVDGRASRTQRSRLAICDACLDLIQDGVLQPGADQIALRAGLSRRSIFYHFADLAELYDAVSEVGMQRCAPLLKEVPADAPISSRIEQLVDVRARFFEATAAFTRALTAQSLVGSASQQAWRVSRRALERQNAEVERVFGAEIESDAHRADTLEALSAAIAAPTWEYLRRGRGLSLARARAVMAQTLAALLRDAGVAID
jgi:TetR/AcrR family transcriptional regulator of autoinduction and epiphytic fitness